MALRDITDSSGGATSSSPSALVGLPAFWDIAESPPKTESENWWDVFGVAVNAKHSISLHELLRTPTEDNPRQNALINNMNEQAVERKVVSILFLSLGSAGRKNLTDRHPYMAISAATLSEMRKNCDQTFRNQRNRTLERYKCFSRKQENNETYDSFGML